MRLREPDRGVAGRRTTDRRAPTLTEAQFLNELIGGLTEKQLRALRVAHANGYFAWPRERTADGVADALGASTPTLTEHLRIAERKLLDGIFGASNADGD